MLMMQRGRRGEERRGRMRKRSPFFAARHNAQHSDGRKGEMHIGENEEVFLNKFNYRAEKRGRYVVA